MYIVTSQKVEFCSSEYSQKPATEAYLDQVVADLQPLVLFWYYREKY
jgi:hypothetical protein